MSDNINQFFLYNMMFFMFFIFMLMIISYFSGVFLYNNSKDKEGWVNPNDLFKGFSSVIFMICVSFMINLYFKNMFVEPLSFPNIFILVFLMLFFVCLICLIVKEKILKLFGCILISFFYLPLDFSMAWLLSLGIVFLVFILYYVFHLWVPKFIKFGMGFKILFMCMFFYFFLCYYSPFYFSLLNKYISYLLINYVYFYLFEDPVEVDGYVIILVNYSFVLGGWTCYLICWFILPYFFYGGWYGWEQLKHNFYNNDSMFYNFIWRYVIPYSWIYLIFMSFIVYFMPDHLISDILLWIWVMWVAFGFSLLVWVPGVPIFINYVKSDDCLGIIKFLFFDLVLFLEKFKSFDCFKMLNCMNWYSPAPDLDSEADCEMSFNKFQESYKLNNNIKEVDGLSNTEVVNEECDMEDIYKY